MFGTKPLSEPMLTYCQLDLYEKQWNLNQNTDFFIKENIFENVVCEMVDIFVQGEMS